jgi:hypothetical protein
MYIFRPRGHKELVVLFVKKYYFYKVSLHPSYNFLDMQNSNFKPRKGMCASL